MSDYVFYSSNYLNQQLSYDNQHHKKIHSHLCNAICQQSCSKKTTHLLFTDSFKNLFRQLKASFSHIADSDLYSLYLYTASCLWPFEGATGKAFKDDIVHLIDTKGQAATIKGKAGKHRRKLAQVVKEIEQELYEEDIIKHYTADLKSLPTMDQLAKEISHSHQVGYTQAWKLASIVILYFEHDYLPLEKNNEERALNFYLRHKIGDNADVRLIYQHPHDLKLNAIKEQDGTVLTCNSLLRSQWNCEDDPPL